MREGPLTSLRALGTRIMVSRTVLSRADDGAVPSRIIASIPGLRLVAVAVLAAVASVGRCRRRSCRRSTDRSCGRRVVRGRLSPRRLSAAWWPRREVRGCDRSRPCGRRITSADRIQRYSGVTGYSRSRCSRLRASTTSVRLSPSVTESRALTSPGIDTAELSPLAMRSAARSGAPRSLNQGAPYQSAATQARPRHNRTSRFSFLRWQSRSLLYDQSGGTVLVREEVPPAITLSGPPRSGFSASAASPEF